MRFTRLRRPLGRPSSTRPECPIGSASASAERQIGRGSGTGCGCYAPVVRWRYAYRIEPDSDATIERDARTETERVHAGDLEAVCDGCSRCELATGRDPRVERVRQHGVDRHSGTVIDAQTLPTLQHKTSGRRHVVGKTGPCHCADPIERRSGSADGSYGIPVDATEGGNL